MRSSDRRGRSGWLVALLLAVLLAAMWAGYLAFEAVLVEAAQLDGALDGGRLRYDPSHVRHDYRAFLAVLSLGLTGVFLGFHRWGRMSAEARAAVYRLAWTTLCAAVVSRMLFLAAYEARWYPVETLIEDPGYRPVFGRRMLFALPTAAVAAWTGLSVERALEIVQTAVAWLAVAAVGAFCRRFGGPLYVAAGQGAFTLLLVGTIDYFNFYDFGIAMFFALGLSAALARRWWLFAAIAGVATLNHENALLLVPAGVAAMWGVESGRRLVLAGSGALGAHLVARGALLLLIPQDKLFELRFWTNAHLIAHPTRELAHSIALLLPCFLAAAFGLRTAPGPLRRMAILFPLLFGVTYLFGKFSEPRVFVASMPVAAALIACGAASLQASLTEPVGSREGRRSLPACLDDRRDETMEPVWRAQSR